MELVTVLRAKLCTCVDGRVAMAAHPTSVGVVTRRLLRAFVARRVRRVHAGSRGRLFGILREPRCCGLAGWEMARVRSVGLHVL